jgi:AraC-like DNA-binding protein
VIFIDLISAINHALPRLVVASAETAPGEELFGPNIGYAFFRPGSSGAIERFDVEDVEIWSNLRSTTVGILGAGAAGDAVARTAGDRFDADVRCHRWAPAADSALDAGTLRETFAKALKARVLCVALPWSEALTAQVRNFGHESVDARTLLVVWRRSLAFERALVYLGHHYVEPILLRNLAAIAHTSRFHLVRLFAATLGITPHRYQLLLRVARAKAMLREGTCVTQIAHGLGFADHSHLDRSFRILMGMTPTQYQRSAER